jgi:hypothetical protein
VPQQIWSETKRKETRAERKEKCPRKNPAGSHPFFADHARRLANFQKLPTRDSFFVTFVAFCKINRRKRRLKEKRNARAKIRPVLSVSAPAMPGICRIPGKLQLGIPSSLPSLPSVK